MNKKYSLFYVVYRNIYEYFKKAKIYGILEQLSFFLRTIFFYINIQIIEFLFDKLEKHNSIEMVIYGLLLVGICKAISEILTLISKNLMVKNSYSNMGKFMVDFQKKLNRVEPCNFEDTNFLDRISRIKECLEYESLGHFATDCIQILIYYTSIIVFTGYYLYSLYPLLVFIVVFAFLPTIINQILNTKYFEAFENNTISIRREADTYKKYIVSRKYFKETRMLGIFGFLYNQYNYLINLIFKEQWKISKKLFFTQICLSLISISGLIFSIILLFFVTINGFISVGKFATVFFILSQLFATIEELVQGKLSNFIATYIQVKNFYELMDMEEKSYLIQEKNIDDGIHLDNVYFKYPNRNNYTIKGIDLKLEPKKTYALVGANGSGKSTLSKLILGIYVPDKGNISIFGLDTKKYRNHKLYEYSTAVFQDFQKYKMTLAENVNISATDKNADEIKIKESLNKSNFMKKIPFDQMLSPEFNGIDLSGGEWQRVDISRAIHKDYELIILDEPTAAIDPIEEAKLYEQFRMFSINKISLIVTHRLASTKFADEIIVMDKGVILEKGTHIELIKNKGLYFDMWKKQEGLYKENL